MTKEEIYKSISGEWASSDILAAMDEFAKQTAIAYSKFCDDLKINADKYFNVPKSMTAEEQYQFYLTSKSKKT